MSADDGVTWKTYNGHLGPSVQSFGDAIAVDNVGWIYAAAAGGYAGPDRRRAAERWAWAQAHAHPACERHVRHDVVGGRDAPSSGGPFRLLVREFEQRTKNVTGGLTGEERIMFLETVDL